MFTVYCCIFCFSPHALTVISHTSSFCVCLFDGGSDFASSVADTADDENIFNVIANACEIEHNIYLI